MTVISDHRSCHGQTGGDGTGLQLPGCQHRAPFSTPICSRLNGTPFLPHLPHDVHYRNWYEEDNEAKPWTNTRGRARSEIVLMRAHAGQVVMTYSFRFISVACANNIDFTGVFKLFQIHLVHPNPSSFVVIFWAIIITWWIFRMTLNCIHDPSKQWVIINRFFIGIHTHAKIGSCFLNHFLELVKHYCTL